MPIAIAASPATATQALSTRREAERLKSIFARTANGSEFPALPLAILFDDLEAFQSVYNDKAGFRRALEDLYGLQGNMRHLFRNYTWDNRFDEVYGNHALHNRYNVGPARLAALCDKMTETQRAEFHAAFDDFTAGLPAMRETNASYTMGLIRPLARLHLALTQGSSALGSRNEDLLLAPSMREIYTRTADPYIIKRITETFPALQNAL